LCFLGKRSITWATPQPSSLIFIFNLPFIFKETSAQ
jgi:hypothetical protein